MAHIIKLNEPRCLQLRVQLVGITPAIWRQVLVPDTITLVKLHKVLQVAMGWLDLHLHEFNINGVRYGQPDPMWDLGPDAVIAEKGIYLKQCLGGLPGYQVLLDALSMPDDPEFLAR